MPYSMGLDYGTNSVRCLIVDVRDGSEVGSAVYEYQSGQQGIILDLKDHNLARQRPDEYIKGIKPVVKQAIAQARKNNKRFKSADIIGVGVDATSSTPLPVNEKGKPLSEEKQFSKNPNAYAWLWKDHTSFAEAAEITEMARREHPEYLAKCGGAYSSEWFFSKILHCLRIDPQVFQSAYTWVECCDYVTGVLTGIRSADDLKRSRCAAGHKAMFNADWGGLPAKDFLAKLSPKMAELRDRLYDKTYTVDTRAGHLSEDWAAQLGLKPGIPVAVGCIDAHMGAVGAGVAQGRMVKIIGTSTCDMLVTPKTAALADVPGICGIVDGSIVPGYWGLEAGQSAVGDIFNWFVNYIQPGGKRAGSHEELTKKAAKLKPGQSGLLALDWNNGNRNILADQRLTGLLVGQTLHTKPEEIYRALIEATAFGALAIIKRLEEYNVSVSEIVCCGGIAEKNDLLMQIYADVTGREMKISRAAQTCALGAAIAGATAAGRDAGGYDSVPEAQAKMCGLKRGTYKPCKANHEVYKRLYSLYRQLHDSFGLPGWSGAMQNVMKDLLSIKDKVISR